MKSLWKISVTTSLEAEDAVIELLGAYSENPASAYFNFETGKNCISVFSEKKFPKNTPAEIAAGLKRIKSCGLEIGAGKVGLAKVKREDWAESWKKHFQPLEIRDALLIKPSWSKKRARKNQAVVILDPGLSFGTGQHPTTSFCLSEIVRFAGNKKAARGDVRVSSKKSAAKIFSEQKSFLDIGTGSGILAIAAAKLDFQPIRAFDFDPEAVRVAQTNAKKNAVGKKIHISRGDVTKLDTRPKQKFDLVCANLISNLLIAERKKIAAQMDDAGVLVLAGILRTEFLEVQKAFETVGLELFRARSEKEWRSGAFRFVKK